MDISVFVSELLFTNDCVIIPGFGGFVTHYSPAKIHPINHSFSPPSKNVLFNSKLLRDDGLLIDYIAEKQSIPYADAKSLVESSTRDMQKKLAAGGVIRFKNIGNLHQDYEDKILFNPDESVNYLDDSYGLPGFTSPPVIRQKVKADTDNKFIDRKPKSNLEQRRKRVFWAYAAVVPVIFILGWYFMFGNWRPDHVQQSGILSIPDSEMMTISQQNQDPVKDSETNPPLESLDFSMEPPEEKEDLEIAESLPDRVIVPVKKYYVIGGAFGVESNADKLVATLRKQGYEAERAGLSRSGLHIVSYFSSEDKSEALANLEIVRRDDNPSAWLLKK